MGHHNLLQFTFDEIYAERGLQLIEQFCLGLHFNSMTIYGV